MVGVGCGELGEGLFLVCDGLVFDELVLGFVLVGGFVLVLSVFGGVFVFDVVDC